MSVKTGDHVAVGETGVTGVVTATQGTSASVQIDGSPDKIVEYTQDSLELLYSTESAQAMIEAVTKFNHATDVPSSQSEAARYSYAYGYVAASAEATLRRIEATQAILSQDAPLWIGDALEYMASTLRDALAHAANSLYA